jgi:hypothetical protein
MDDHIYNEILDYAECGLLPRFRNEFSQCGNMTKCPSYGEVQALCKALNAIAPYAGYGKTAPHNLI